jgi:uncharacterized damage-inducible protein DinB
MFDITELYQYSSAVRRRFLEKLESLPWQLVTKNREASFYGMENILIHIIDNEDWIANRVAPNRATEYKRARKSEEYASMQMVRNHLEEVEIKTKTYLQKADEKEMERRANFVLSSTTWESSSHSSGRKTSSPPECR